VGDKKKGDQSKTKRGGVARVTFGQTRMKKEQADPVSRVGVLLGTKGSL